jgi:glutamate carboxypeptidase
MTPVNEDRRAGERLIGLRGRQRAMVEQLGALVQTETPSEDLQACRAGAGRIREIASLLIDEVPEEVVIEGRTHLRWHWPTDGPTRVLLLGHFDTVWPLGTVDGWPASTQRSVFSGPGCFDMKAGIVQLLHAVSTLEDRSGIEILLTSDEEIGSQSSRALIEAAARRSTATLVFEPSQDGAPKIGRKGAATYQLEIKGRAAHAGLEPEKGANALVAAAMLICDVTSLARIEAGTTVTPTFARAGSASNVIPALARVDLDVRASEGEELDRVDRELRALTTRIPDTQLTVGGGPSRPPMLTRQAARLAALATDAASRLGLRLPAGVVVGGASDGNFTAAVGCPTLDGLGAVGGGAHAAGEWVDIESIPERAAMAAELVESLRSGSSARVLR